MGTTVFGRTVQDPEYNPLQFEVPIHANWVLPFTNLRPLRSTEPTPGNCFGSEYPISLPSLKNLPYSVFQAFSSNSNSLQPSFISNLSETRKNLAQGQGEAQGNAHEIVTVEVREQNTEELPDLLHLNSRMLLELPPPPRVSSGSSLPVHIPVLESTSRKTRPEELVEKIRGKSNSKMIVNTQNVKTLQDVLLNQDREEANLNDML